MNMKDVFDYVDHVSGTVEPMLGRLRIARKQIMLATSNGYDFLSEGKYRNLKDILTSLSEVAHLNDDEVWEEDPSEGGL